MTSDAVVFLGMVYPWGIIRHFAMLGIELYRTRHTYDYYFASISREPDKGAWNEVRRVIDRERLVEAADFPGLVRVFDDLLSRYNRVLIHCGGGWGQTRSLLPLRKKYGKRLILVGTTHSFRNDSWQRIPMSIFQTALYAYYYDMIIFQCRDAVDKFWGSRLLFTIGKGIVVPLGCELFDVARDDVPRFVATNSELNRALLASDLFKFVYLAAFRPGKNHEWLVRAMSAVLQTHRDVRLLLCGTGEPQVIDATRKAIEAEGLERQILLTGHIPRTDVPWLLQHVNCAVVASRAETFGHNFLEPMFAALPVLGTNVGIGRDIIRDGETGFHFTLNDEKTFQTAALRLIENRNETRRMGERAKTLVQNDFTHAAVAQRLTDVYSEEFKKR